MSEQAGCAKPTGHAGYSRPMPSRRRATASGRACAPRPKRTAGKPCCRPGLDTELASGVWERLQSVEALDARLWTTLEHRGLLPAPEGGSSPPARILGKSLILAVARMCEFEKGYALRSIPAAFKHLESHREQLQINDRDALLRAVHKLGQDESNINDAPDSVLTLAAARAFSTRF